MNLKEQVLIKCPKAEPYKLEILELIVNRFNIPWVTSKYGGASFVMDDLHIVKDRPAKHYSDLRNEIGPHINELKGKCLQLVDNQLENYRKIYRVISNKELPNEPTWVGDWEHAYEYIIKEINVDVSHRNRPLFAVKSLDPIDHIDRTIRKGLDLSEWEIQRDLLALSTFGTYRLTAEEALPDYPQSRCETRRVDLVRRLPHKTMGQLITLYELKKEVITLEDVVSTIEAKQYLTLAANKYNCHSACLDLVFIAPFGSTIDAEVRASSYGNVSIQSVAEFASFLVDKAREKHKQDAWFIKEEVEKKLFYHLLRPPMRAVSTAA